MNKNPISKELYNSWQSLNEQAQALEQEIVDRLSFVINRACEMFGQPISTWYFDDAQEGEVGDVWENIHRGEFAVTLDFKKNSSERNMTIVLNDGTELDIARDGFLTRWLFEDFEKEIHEGKFKYKEKEIKRKTELKKLSEQKRVEQEELIRSAKSKLSRQELAALKKAL